MTLPKIPVKDRRDIVAFIQELANQNHCYHTVAYYMDRFKVDFRGYRLVSELAMPTIQYAQLYNRTLNHYKAMKRELRDTIKRAKLMRKAGGAPEKINAFLIDTLEELYARNNHVPEGLSESEAGVIEEE